jgi:Do/DeqQ family serine protease
MNEQFTISKRVARTAAAVFASTLVVTGIAWRGITDEQKATAVKTAATVTSPLAQHAIAGARDSYADVVDVVAPGVVTVHASGKAKMQPTQFQLPDGDDFFQQFFGNRGQRSPRGQMPRTFKQQALGSGVIVTTDGYVLTNYHVVDGADDIKVDLNDDRTLTAKVVGTDKPSDLALLKISGSNFHPVALGDSDAVKVGDVVLAVGNPLNVGQTVTMGIISGKGRSTSTGVGSASYEDFLQTDAPINHGNSGGALVNTKGELVGINSQILSDGGEGNIGIGFAIPVNMAKHVMEDLRTKGKVTRSQLGVTVQQVTPDMAANLGLKDASGVIVSGVSADSAAAHAGLKQGDVIKSFNGKPVHDTNSLRNRVADAGPGSTAELVIVRDGAEKHLTAKLDEANPDTMAARRDSGESNGKSDDKTALGVSVAPLTRDMADQLHAKNAHGLVVEDVDPDGRAADAGIRQGDIIESVNRQSVSSIEDLRSAIKRTTDRPTLLLINRNGNEIFVTVKPANNG